MDCPTRITWSGLYCHETLMVSNSPLFSKKEWSPDGFRFDGDYGMSIAKLTEQLIEDDSKMWEGGEFLLKSDEKEIGDVEMREADCCEEKDAPIVFPILDYMKRNVNKFVMKITPNSHLTIDSMNSVDAFLKASNIDLRCYETLKFPMCLRVASLKQPYKLRKKRNQKKLNKIK